MTAQVADAHTHVQRLVSVVKMATNLEAVLPKNSVPFFVFCGQKDSLQRIFITFLVYGRKCFLGKAIHNWSEKRTKPFADDERVETEVRKWARQRSKTSIPWVSKQW
jgi:hypothetical protein